MVFTLSSLNYINDASDNILLPKLPERNCDSSMGLDSTTASHELDETGLKKIDIEVYDNFTSKSKTAKKYPRT